MAIRTRAPRRRSALLLGLLAVACGGSGARVPAARSGADGADAAAERYDTAERPNAVLGARDPAAFERVMAAVGRGAGVALRGDGRLALLARRFADACRGGVDAAAVSDAARRTGLVDPTIELACASAEQQGALPPALAAELGARVRSLSATHFGLFVGSDQRTVTAALSRRALALVPVPRRVVAGTPLRLRGRVDAVFAQPRVVVSGPDGERSFPGGTGPDFDMQIPTPHPGCYRLQLLARAGERVHTLAELRASAGDAAQPDACAADATPVTARELAALRRGLEQQIANLRAAGGLHALVVDAQLARAAEQAGAGATPASGQTVSSGDASASAGGTLLALVRAKDAAALWQALAGDSARRAKLLDAGVTHVGVSVRPEAGAWAAAVVLARLAPAADLELAPARLLDAINRNRAARGAPALRPDAVLTRVAQTSAAAFFAAPARSEREIVADANAELERFGLSYRRVAALAMLVADPLDAAALEPALEAGAGATGIAVAQGIREGGAVRTLAVVIALGWDR